MNENDIIRAILNSRLNTECRTITCPKCGREVEVEREPQIKGFRDPSSMWCPYKDCDWTDDNESWDYDYYCYRKGERRI